MPRSFVARSLARAPARLISSLEQREPPPMLRDGAPAATWDALVKLGSKPCLLATAVEDLFYLRNEFRRSREIPFTRE